MAYCGLPSFAGKLAVSEELEEMNPSRLTTQECRNSNRKSQASALTQNTSLEGPRGGGSVLQEP